MIDILALVWLHFLGDFIPQTREIATKKSVSYYWLSLHVMLYMIPMLVFGAKFALVNGVLHFCTDWATSRGTTYFWKKGNDYGFFTLIGFDQAIHLTTLILTLRYL